MELYHGIIGGGGRASADDTVSSTALNFELCGPKRFYLWVAMVTHVLLSKHIPNLMPKNVTIHT